MFVIVKIFVKIENEIEHTKNLKKLKVLKICD
jgi:hypothetical protein